MRRSVFVGQRYTKLIVVKRVEDHISPSGYHEPMWLCLCDCGNYCTTSSSNLTTKDTKSCGCLKKKHHNKYEFVGDICVGYTYKNEKFYFDSFNYDLIKDYSWYIDSRGYVSAGPRLLMHRLIMNPKPGEWVDHINHETYNNCVSNLRIVNSRQNAINSNKKVSKDSGIRGVTLSDGKWRSTIYVNGKKIHLGIFDNIDDAIKVRKTAEEKYFGEYSYDNSIKIAKSTEQMLAEEREKIKSKETEQADVKRMFSEV